MLKSIFKIKFGSFLYGTQTPNSDLDIKEVFIPKAEDIILGSYSLVKNSSSKKGNIEKNSAEDVDTEAYAVKKFMELLAEGQTVALDMLFAPEFAWLQKPDPLWFYLLENKNKVISKKIQAFVGYCRQQAGKYCVKGERVASAKLLQKFLENKPSNDILGKYQNEFPLNEHISLLDIKGLLHLNILERKIAFSSKIWRAKECVDRIVQEYGKRALQAETNDGVDWKALSHAVRVGKEVNELLTTENITFPLIESDLLLQIKLGKLPYTYVAELIEKELALAEQNVLATKLPENPDVEFIKHFIIKCHWEGSLVNLIS